MSGEGQSHLILRLPPTPSPAHHLEEAGGVGVSSGGDMGLQGAPECDFNMPKCGVPRMVCV